MRKLSTMLIAIIIFAGIVGIADAYQKYSLVQFPDTKGYDPEFLKDSLVKTTCAESHKDLMRVGLQDLGYCDKKLGTL